jgi:carbonic anhydrase
VLNIAQVETRDQIDAVQKLFRDYISWAVTLGANPDKVPTFQGVDEEIATLPGIYSPPAGRLLLASYNAQPAGCVALKPHHTATGELKRLYVDPAFRDLGIGRELVATLLDEARKAGYQNMVLDSHISMKAAHRIYHEHGFRDVDAPADFPEAIRPFAVFMACDL